MPNAHSIRPAIASALLSASIPACGINDTAELPPAPFEQSGVSRRSVAIAVREGGRALSGVRVMLRTVDGADEFAPGLLWRGVTDSNGRVQTAISLRADQRQVEVLAYRPGLVGPYTTPAERAASGAFAPSAWYRVDASALGALSLPLTPAPSTAPVAATAGNNAGAHPSERAFIDAQCPIPQALTEALGAQLLSHWSYGAKHSEPARDPNLTVRADTGVSVTFVHEGSAWRNSLGYFVWRANGDTVTVVDAQLVFPNASYQDATLGGGGGHLAPGDAVTLRGSDGAPRIFAAGTRIGFFLVADGWDGARVAGWNAASPSYPSVTPTPNTIGRGLYTTLDALNPEANGEHPDLARHFVRVRVVGASELPCASDAQVFGVEDARRDQGADDDFNDLVFLVKSATVDALTADDTRSFNPANVDPDGDGTPGLDDAWPDDLARSLYVRSPPLGYQTLAFEDNYPNLGDADYNDAVVQYAFEEALNTQGDLVDLVGTFHLVARGAGFDAAFGVALHDLPAAATATVRVERFDVTGRATRDAVVTLRATPDADGRPMIRFDDVIPSMRAAMPPMNTENPTPNSPPASVRVIIHFDTAVPRAPIGAAPFDPYLLVRRDLGRYDIHRPGVRGFPGRPSSLPEERGSNAFIDDDGYPWLLVVPDSWRFPLEDIPIDDRVGHTGAYPTFPFWRRSAGAREVQWYRTPRTPAPTDFVSDPVATRLCTRAWTISADL
jgi:LruC domain-containing protein